MLRSQLLFDFSIVVDFAFLRVNEQNLSRLQASFRGHFRWVEIHDAHLGSHHHRIVFGDGITGGSQAIAVEHTTGKASVAEKQGCRTIPRFHQNGMIFIKGLQIF